MSNYCIILIIGYNFVWWLSTDKGKLGENQGRKTKGPSLKVQDGSQLPKGGVDMIRKRILNSTIAIFFILLISSTASAQNAIVDVNNLDKGIVKINYKNNVDNMKVLITKGNKRAHYNLESNMNYPLQFGNGEYTISILEHVRGNKYRQIDKETVKLELKDERELFLQPIQMVNWNEDMAAIKKAKELTRTAKGDEEKVKAIYNYITDNIKYDDEKAYAVESGYIPYIDATLKSQSGICYDYAVLTAAMLRSLDIPTKLIMGYKSDIKKYHAWNQIYLNGKWVNIDTTYDSAYVRKKVPISMIKDAKEYRIEKIY